MSALSYWNGRFTDHAADHSRQNSQIAIDLCNLVTGDTGVGYYLLRQALNVDSIVEIGCGTGELSARIKWLLDPKIIIATDFSEAAIEKARIRYPFMDFRLYDVLIPNSLPTSHHFDTAICSNVLEHFTADTVRTVIDRILGFADRLLAVVPLGQQDLDDFDAEGGAGHVTCFDNRSFVHWHVADSVTFRTDGWSCSSSAMQWAVLLERRR